MLALLQQAGEESSVAGARLLVGALAAVVSVVCVVVHYEVMSSTSRLLPRIGLRRRTRVVGLILAILAAHVAEVWIFGLTYWVLDAWPALGGLTGPLEEGLFDFVYFSVVMYTSLGMGDILPVGPVRILAGTEALVGLGLITWSASLAFLEMQRDWVEFRRPR